MTADNFLEIPFTYDNLDRYVVRTAIRSAVTSFLPLMQGRLLDAGCGSMPYRDYIRSGSRITEYVGLDIENQLEYGDAVQPDFRWDGRHMPFEDGSFGTVLATEVLEHCPDPGLFLNEASRVLAPGGLFFFTVPFLWNLHEVPYDEYRYTPFALKRLLETSGFVEPVIEATGGWHASLAQLLGLWVRRSGLSSSKQRLLSFAIKPSMRLLLDRDTRTPVRFVEGTMITGLRGYARRATPA